MTAAQQAQSNYISFHLLCQIWLENENLLFLKINKKKKVREKTVIWKDSKGFRFVYKTLCYRKKYSNWAFLARFVSKPTFLGLTSRNCFCFSINCSLGKKKLWKTMSHTYTKYTWKIILKIEKWNDSESWCSTYPEYFIASVKWA